MRIIAGSARRVQLEVADESSTRPFLEMARGALFNSLGGVIAEADVLDVFAGSGALGLEALSRGAAACVFVERDARAAAALARNAGKCRFESVSRIVRDDALRALAGMAADGYDVAFFDPPFPDLPEWRPGGAAEALMREAARVMRPGGIVVFRLEDGKAAVPDWPGLALTNERRYGRSRVARYRRDGREEDL